MRRFTTILCALTIILSASAAPLFSGKRQSEVLKQMDKTQLTQFFRHKKAQQASHFVHSPKAATPQPLRLQTKLADQVPDTVVISSCNATLYPEDGAIWYGLYTDDWSKSFYFSILVQEGKHDVELGRTYTLADMEEGSVNHWEDDEWNEHPYASATFTKTRGAGYDVHVLATLTDEDGKSFVLKYDEAPVTITGDTVDIAFTDSIPNMEYISDGTWLFRAGGEQFGYSVQLSYYSNNQLSCGGSFSGDDIEPTSTVLSEFYVDEMQETQVNFISVKDGSFVVLDTDSAIYVNGTLFGVFEENAKVYRLDLTVRKPQAKQEVTITADNLSIDDYWYDMMGEVKFLASDNLNEVELVIYPDGLAEEMAGTYTIALGGTRAMVRTVDPMDDVETNAFSGTLELNYDKGSILITGSILCYDNTLYTLNLSYIKPEKTREQELNFDSLDLAVFEDNSWQVLGYNSNNTAYISIAAIPANFGPTSGTYTEKEIVADYSYVVTDIQGGSYKMFSILTASLTMDYSAADSIATVAGTLLCVNVEDAADVPEFTISIKATIPNPYAYDESIENFEHNFANFSIDTTYAEYGELYIDAMDQGYMIGLKFAVAEGTTTPAAGTYAINNMGDLNTVVASPGMTPTGQLRYSYAALVDEAKRQILAAWFLVSGNVTVSENGVVTIDALNSKGKRVNCVLGATEDVENVEAKTAATKRIVNGQLLIEKNGRIYNVLGTAVR